MAIRFSNFGIQIRYVLRFYSPNGATLQTTLGQPFLGSD
ncbi:hypothetical protein L917_09421 [Phytophthora nicotianae]|uniref:Uncharacterized protein n=1 Tax=Phytophthora nicotianae TaxID=4792 RepID=W2IYC9_PHYNI|nr:hypothetical protein L915_09588 [Phytophthora nicotianae]ETL39101.1 hypothetical protein L916_09488 [Phytophthora nicotianae]ETL92213.1 hypothetical protein L917_09421 [Phytophthora nicotianae]